MSELVTRALSEKDWSGAVALYEQAFGKDRLFNTIPRHSQFNYSHLRGAFFNGHLIGMVYTRFHTLHYGVTQWRIGVVNAVVTEKQFRGHGVASLLMQDVLAFFAESGAHLALVNTGLKGFFNRFGFSTMLPTYKLTSPVTELQTLKSNHTVRHATFDDIRSLTQLYNRHWGSRVTFSRDLETWHFRVGQYASDVAVSENGQVEGYLWRHPTDELRAEVVVNSLGALFALLRSDASGTHGKGKDALTWIIPPDDWIVSLLRPYVDLSLSAEYRPTSGWMGRLIDSNGFVQGLLQEVHAHIRTLFPDFSDKVTIVAKSDLVQIQFRKHACQLSHRDFIQVVFGSLSPEMLSLHSPLTEPTIDMLNLLFPRRIACLGAWDWF